MRQNPFRCGTGYLKYKDRPKTFFDHLVDFIEFLKTLKAALSLFTVSNKKDEDSSDHPYFG